MLSDLFYEKTQYDWMFSTLMTLQGHHIVEDELMNQYMLLGLCKAAAMQSAVSAFPVCASVGRMCVCCKCVCRVSVVNASAVCLL